MVTVGYVIEGDMKWRSVEATKVLQVFQGFQKIYFRDISTSKEIMR